MAAGTGLCDRDAVRVLVDEGPAAVRGLVGLGTRFDTATGGDLALTREGGHDKSLDVLTAVDTLGYDSTQVFEDDHAEDEHSDEASASEEEDHEHEE